MRTLSCSSINFSLLTKAAFWLACLVVTALSLVPADQLPPTLFDWWDKAQHCLAFFSLASLGLLAYAPRYNLMIYLGLVVLGAAIEIAQAWLGWRQGDFMDLVADLIGLSIAFPIFHFYRHP